MQDAEDQDLLYKKLVALWNIPNEEHYKLAERTLCDVYEIYSYLETSLYPFWFRDAYDG